MSANTTPLEFRFIFHVHGVGKCRALARVVAPFTAFVLISYIWQCCMVYLTMDISFISHRKIYKL